MIYLKQITSTEIQNELIIRFKETELNSLSEALEAIDCYEGENQKVLEKWMDQTGIVDTYKQFVSSYKLLLTLLLRSKVIDPWFLIQVENVTLLLEKKG